MKCQTLNGVETKVYDDDDDDDDDSCHHMVLVKNAEYVTFAGK